MAAYYNLGQNRWKICTPTPPSNQGSSLIWGRGDGGLLFHFILSKIVDSSEAEVMQSFLGDESVSFSHKRYMLQLSQFLSQAFLVFGYVNVC